MSLKKLFLALGLIAGGLWIWIYRLSLVRLAIGSTRMRVGKLFSVDRLYYFILFIKAIAATLLVAGVLMIVWQVRCVRTSAGKK